MKGIPVKKKREPQHQKKDTVAQENKITVHNLNLHNDNNQQYYYFIFRRLKQAYVAKALAINIGCK